MCKYAMSVNLTAKAGDITWTKVSRSNRPLNELD